MKKGFLNFIFGISASILAGYVAFQFNVFGLQDNFYHSLYFRPYAHLKQEPWYNQVTLLKDGKILLIGVGKYSEIFDPRTRSSELVAGLQPMGVYSKFVKLLTLSDGNVLITQGRYIYDDINCDEPGGIHRSGAYCPKGKTLLFDAKLKKFRWVPFQYQDIKSHTLTLLPNGNVAIIGGKIDPPNVKTGRLTYKAKPHLNNIILYNPKTYESKVIGHLQIARYDHHSVLINKHQLLVFGGRTIEPYFKGKVIKPEGKLIRAVELVDSKTGDAQIIGYLDSESQIENVVLLDDNKVIACWDAYLHGYTHSEIFDLSRPNAPIIIPGKGLSIGEGLGKCNLLPNGRLIAISRREVREIDPINLKSQILDRLPSPPLFYPNVFLIPDIGLLVFGDINQSFFASEMKHYVVQIFNYERYLKDIERDKS